MQKYSLGMLRSDIPHCFMFNASTTIFPQIGEMEGQREKSTIKREKGKGGGGGRWARESQYECFGQLQ